MSDSQTIERVPIADLKLDPLNPRVMPNAERAALAGSLDAFGFLQPVVARRSDGLVIGGHQRIEAARELGWEAVPVAWWEGSDQDARVLNLALNRIHGDWDDAKLADVLAELAGVDSLQEALRGFDTTQTALAGFDEREVLAVLEAKLDDGPRAEDLTALAGALVSAPARAASAEPGALYELGSHRVLCGDARDPDAVGCLVGTTHPAMLWTDPPYGVGYTAEGSGGAASSGRPTGRRDRPLGPIAGDDLEPEAHADLVTAALRNAAAMLAPGGGVYVCGGTSTTTLYDAAFEASGLEKSSIIVWDKTHFAFGRRDYQSQSELVYYGWKRGARHSFFGGRVQGDIWPIPTDAAAGYVHPTQKPVALAERAIRNSSRAGDAVLDLFGGSGSTLIAAEQAGRRALLLELDPHYVGVIVARWQAFTGLQARQVAGAVPERGAAHARNPGAGLLRARSRRRWRGLALGGWCGDRPSVEQTASPACESVR